MTPEFVYQIEKLNDDKSWMVYKQENELPETKVGYLVELNVKGMGLHRCSCAFGKHQEKQGIMLYPCKHVGMVLEERQGFINRKIEEVIQILQSLKLK